MAEHAGQKRSSAPAAAEADQRASASGPHSELLNRRTEARLAGPAQILARRSEAVAAAAPRPVQPLSPPNRTGLPDRLKAGIEALSGIAMDEVRVHRNSTQPAKLGGLAYTCGDEIHLGPGQERHLGHEAWHVVQQKQGRVRATAQLKGSGVELNADPALEREADLMGACAAGVEPRPLPELSGAGVSGRVVQRTIVKSVNPRVMYDDDKEVRKAVTQEAAKWNVSPGIIEFIMERVHRNESDFDVHAAMSFAVPIFAQEMENQSSWKGSGANSAEWDDEEEKSSGAYDSDTDMAGPSSDEASEQEPAAMASQPRSLQLLHDNLPRQVRNYEQWLLYTQNWQDRPKKVTDNLAAASQLIGEAGLRLHAAFSEFPLQPEMTRRRQKAYEALHFKGIADKIAEIEDLLIQIDMVVTEPPVKPREWAGFFGDEKYEYGDGAGTPIPIIFYKEETNYSPIIVPVNAFGVTPDTYPFPDGPRGVPGKNGKYDITVKQSSRFKLNDVLTNAKDTETRNTQVDINSGLKKLGVSMAGLDGDHVRDLGFGGTDTADNYWPLAAKVNRRPFLGWRGSYGVNYVSSDGTHKTASITALAGKNLRIAGFMASGDGNVPAIGIKPAVESGMVKIRSK